MPPGANRGKLEPGANRVNVLINVQDVIFSEDLATMTTRYW